MNHNREEDKMVGLGGVEPPHTEPESAVLPLYYSPENTTINYGWAGRIRTPAYMDQNHVSYHLTTAQRNLLYLAEREGFEPSVRFNPHTRLAGAHLQPARSPLQFNKDQKKWRRMRDSNPHGQSPAVFKTAVLPIRTNPPDWDLNK
jgi:hypothetical protein